MGSRDFKILFNLGPYNFLAYLECVRSYAWSKGHSDPDLCSVILDCMMISEGMEIRINPCTDMILFLEKIEIFSVCIRNKVYYEC